MKFSKHSLLLPTIIIGCILIWLSFGICEEKPSSAELETMIDIWETQLKSKDASRVLNEIGMKYGYKILKNTKIVPILTESLNPLVDNKIRSEGEGEYLHQLVETLGHIGDKRAIPVLKMLDQSIAKSAIKEILEADYLKLTITSNKGIYRRGEDIIIYYDLKNVTNEKALIINQKLHDPWKHSFAVHDVAGNKYRAIFSDKTPMRKNQYFVLESQKSFNDKLKITKNPNHNDRFDEWDYGIRAPGIYTITAEYENYIDRVYDSNLKQYVYIDAWIGTVFSDPITIKIVE